MIIGLDVLINRRSKTRKRNKIDIIDNGPSANSIEEAKAKVQAIIDSGKKRRKEKNQNGME